MWLAHDRNHFFFPSRRRRTRLQGDGSSDVCSSDLEALQSPTAVQSDGGVTATKRGIGALVDAEPTVETGASERLPFEVDGGLLAGMAKKLGICALSVADGLASTTSYTA